MFDWFKTGAKVVGQAIGLADKVVLDRDLIVQLAADNHLKELEAYIAAVTVKTIPAADALHKLARPLIIYFVLALAAMEAWFPGVDVSSGAWQTILILGGGYTALKGRGK